MPNPRGGDLSVRRIAIAFSCALASAVLAGGAAASEPPENAEIRRQIDRLSSSDFEAREEALRRLVEIGAKEREGVLSALPPEDALDPELARSVQEVRRKLDPRRLQALAAAAGDPRIAEAAESLFEALGAKRHLAIVDFARACGYLLHDERFIAWDSGIPLEAEDKPVEEGKPRRFTAKARIDGESAVRAWCAYGREPNAKAAAGVVAAFLDHPDAMMRHTAVEALERIGHRDTLEEAVELLADPDLNVRVGALRCLSRNLVPKALPRAAELLSGKDLVMRTEGIYAVKRYKEEAREYLPLLAALLHADDKGTPRFAAGAMGAILGTGWSEDEDSLVQARAWWEEHRKALRPEPSPKR